jgi:cytidyltransferase-like protein
MYKPKAIIVSGYFNPIHKGHLAYFELAKTKGDILFVIVNSDLQRALKGSKFFQEEDERLQIVRSMRVVEKAILSIDKDRTVCATLEFLYQQYCGNYSLAFANGGDQSNEIIPERDICERLGIELIDGLGDKIQSSSWLLK